MKCGRDCQKRLTWIINRNESTRLLHSCWMLTFFIYSQWIFLSILNKWSIEGPQIKDWHATVVVAMELEDGGWGSWVTMVFISSVLICWVTMVLTWFRFKVFRLGLQGQVFSKCWHCQDCFDNLQHFGNIWPSNPSLREAIIREKKTDFF